MHIILLVLACLAYTSRGRRVQTLIERRQRISFDESHSSRKVDDRSAAHQGSPFDAHLQSQAGHQNPLRVLGALLLALDPAAGFHLPVWHSSLQVPLRRVASSLPFSDDMLSVAANAAAKAAAEAMTLAVDAVAPIAESAVEALTAATSGSNAAAVEALAIASATADAAANAVAPLAAMAADILTAASSTSNVAAVGTIVAVVAAVRGPQKEDGAETSFMAVARWPDLKVYTFGEAAFSGNEVQESWKFPGSRVIIRGDPVPNYVGQIVGYRHPRFLPILDLEDDELVQTDMLRAQSNLSSLDLDSKKIFTPADEKELHVDEKKEPSGSSFSASDLKKVFMDSDWAAHDMTLYMAKTRDRLLQKKRSNAREDLEAYRMASLTKLMSYVDANESNIKAALELLNSLTDPTRPRRPLYDKKLEHVMSFQFYTPANPFSRVLNPLGYLFIPEAPLSSEGIPHNIHLVRDADNNGYLTFQGTTNLATWFDVNFAFGRYDPGKHGTQFANTVDDERWGKIEPGYLYNCHTGFCVTLKAFVSCKEFPLLAKKIAEMRSLSVMGHSFGGSVASMFAMSVAAIKDLQRMEQGLDRLRGVQLLRALWSEEPQPDDLWPEEERSLGQSLAR